MSFLAPDANGIIKQSGTDLNYTGLIGLTGVTVTQDAGIKYYDFSTNRLQIEGTIYHDPEAEVLIFHHTSTSTAASTSVLMISYATNNIKTVTAWTRNASGNLIATSTAHGYAVGDAVEVRGLGGGASLLHLRTFRVEEATANTVTLGKTSMYLTPTGGQLTRRASYNFGKEITASGRTRYSAGTGIIFSGNSTSNWNPAEYSLELGQGHFWGRGGTIVTERPFTLSNGFDIAGTEFVSTREGSKAEIRTLGTGYFEGGSLVNMTALNPQNATRLNLSLKGSTFAESLGSYYELSLRDFDVSKNAASYDIGHGANIQYHHRDYEIINSANGSNVIAMWRDTLGNSSQKGCVVTKKEVSFALKDVGGSPVVGAKVYLKDTPSPYAKNATFAVPTVGGVYTAAPALLNGTLNANGTITYNYASPFVYNYATDASGNVPTFKVTTSAQIREFSATDSSALASNGGPYAIPSFNTNWRETDNSAPVYADWDTGRFGGFYRVDRRSISNTSADDFTFKLCSYQHGLSQTTQILKGVGTLQVGWVMFNDTLITADRATADGYTELNTPQAFYNRAKAFLVDYYAGETATIVSREGNTINAGTYNVTIDSNAASVFAFNGSTITIKATQFVGNITGSGTFTLLNGAEVVGTFGSTTVYPWEVSNIEAGATLQVFNVTKGIQIENFVVSGTAGTKVNASGAYATSEAVPGDTIRIRLTCQAGTSALLPFEAVGVATASGASFRADQEPDAIYNANNIDGSAITGITLNPDYTNIQIDLDDQEAPYELSAQAIYNYYAYLITTSQGIANFYGALTPIDRMNYRINSAIVPLKIQNTGSSDVVLNGGRIYRDDNVSVIATGAGAGTGSLMQDTGFLVQYIQPQVVDALGGYDIATSTGLAATEAALKKKITQAALL